MEKVLKISPLCVKQLDMNGSWAKLSQNKTESGMKAGRWKLGEEWKNS